MTIQEVLTEVDALKPNQYDDQIKIKWLSTLDGKIFKEIILTHELPLVEVTTENEDGDHITEEVPFDSFNGYTENDMSVELIVSEPYSDIYTHYIFAMIDYNNQEMERYTNSMLMFNSKYNEFAAWYNRTHMPLQINPKLF